MKILVTGDREWTGATAVQNRLEGLHQHPVPLLIHGDCRGLDRMAGTIASLLGWDVHPEPADWKRYNRAAGAIRNRVMLDMGPDIVLGFHDNIKESKGTKDCLGEARRRGIPYELWNSAGERLDY